MTADEQILSLDVDPDESVRRDGERQDAGVLRRIKDDLIQLSRARLPGVKCAMAGKNLYMRFTCSTGDTKGMNMVSKDIQNVLDYLQDDVPDMNGVSI